VTVPADRRTSDGTEPGVVSVVVLHEGALAETLDCIDSLDRLDWPADRLEVVVVDLGSVEGSARRLRQAAPRAIVADLHDDPGRAGALNRGVGATSGEWLAFLATRNRPEPGWLRHAVDMLAGDSSLVCAASRVVGPSGAGLDWPPRMSFTGHPVTVEPGGDGGVDHDVGAADGREVLFGPLEAMVIRAGVFRSVGGFDPRYERDLEDVDLGWRLWLLGHRVVYAAHSVVTRLTPVPHPVDVPEDERIRTERNALFTVYKNYDDASLAAALPAALALAAHRGVVLDDLAARAGGATYHSRASARAVDAFIQRLPELTTARQTVQESRQRTDQELFRTVRMSIEPDLALPAFAEGFEETVQRLGVAERFGPRRRIVVATCDTLTPKMAGPAIRAWQIAAALSAEHDVHLVTTTTATISDSRFAISAVGDRELRELERWCDVFLFQGWVLAGRPYLQSSTKVLIADIYDPMHLEALEQGRDGGEDARLEAVTSSTTVLNQQLSRGDFFLCASRKQRDFWLGHLAALGRVNPRSYDEDEMLASLITVVPFGISNVPPVHRTPAIKGVVPGIGLDDLVLLWGGGIYNWFDPLTLLRAVDLLRRRVPAVKLFFMGLRHPNPDIPEMRMAVAARALSAELGLTGTHVFFNEGWVDYDERQNYLLEADVGVSIHLDHIETALSFRTRVLDYLWASLPVIATKGDALAELIEAHGLGITVPPNDVEALEEALFRILDDDGFRKTCRENEAAMIPDMRWSEVLAPLMEFCRAPRRAPDLLDPRAAQAIRVELGEAKPGSGWRHDLRSGLEYLQWGGPPLLARKALGRVRRLLA
jgi:glycosyltransferase involved in cell wall biosynthesis